MAGSVWRATCGVWQAAYVSQNHDVGQYGSLNFFFSVATQAMLWTVAMVEG